MEKNEKQTVSVQLHIDLPSNKVLGALLNKDEIQSEGQLNLVSEITNRIQSLFNSDGSDWIDDYLKYVRENKLTKACNLLINKFIFLKLPLSKSIFDDLLKLDFRKLSKKKQFTYLDHITLLGYGSKFYRQIEPLVEMIENDYKEFIRKEMQGKIYLMKSDIYIKTDRQLSANRLLNLVINDSEYSDSLRAYAYRQLSWICNAGKDKLTYIEHAHDLFLMSGQKREALQELIGAYEILISTSPAEALNKIDLAIQLLETDSNIDKAISAQLYRKKAYALYIQKRYSESFKEIEKAIVFQQDLFGNESEKYSVYTFAAQLMKIIGNKEKQNEFSIIANSLKNKLQSDEDMNMLFALEESIDLKKEIADETKDKILKEGDPEMQFGFFLLSALNENTPYDEKLALLDKALQIQEKSIQKVDAKSVVYNAIAEIYNEHGDVNKAIEWFEKTFSIDPLNNGVINHYVHLLRSNNLWDQLENLCKRYIDIAGCDPEIYYIYGESLLNQSKYKEALIVFSRCKKDFNFSVDNEILLCSVNASDSGIVAKSSLRKKKEIGIGEFVNAAKEVTDSISQRSRMHLWKYDKNKKMYKWENNPEEEVKNLFIQGIVQKYNPPDFEIIDEVKTGAGRIDLYVLIGKDLKIIIELKMCGGGYSSNYATHGENQLANYLASKNLSLGVLIVFDGRSRDFSKGFSPIISKDNKFIHTIVVDMRPIFE
jgi:tetratricopeptide (TPR) repeat protein